MWGLCCFWGLGVERTRLFHSAVYVLAVLTWLFTTRGTHGLHITGENKSVPFSVDREARWQIGCELGHGRIDVVAAYIGGRV